MKKDTDNKIFDTEKKRMETDTLNKKLEQERKTGFKSYEEVMDYLKKGGVVGDFYGEYGENDMSNNFMVMDMETGNIKFHRQVVENYEMFGEMRTKTVTPQEMKVWVENLMRYKTDEGYIPVHLFHKNFDCDAEDVKEMNVLETINRMKIINRMNSSVSQET